MYWRPRSMAPVRGGACGAWLHLPRLEELTHDDLEAQAERRADRRTVRRMCPRESRTKAGTSPFVARPTEQSRLVRPRRCTESSARGSRLSGWDTRTRGSRRRERRLRSRCRMPLRAGRAQSAPDSTTAPRRRPQTPQRPAPSQRREHPWEKESACALDRRYRSARAPPGRGRASGTTTITIRHDSVRAASPHR